MSSLSRIINNKLLPKLRELGIPCPDTACDCHRLATEYHEFTICTLIGGKYESARGRAILMIPGLHLSRITPIIPSTADSLFELSIDIEKKILQLEDPKLFELALAIITTRWRAMQRYEDICLLNHIETHSHTERALFSQHHINRLLFLAGHEPNMWVGTYIPWASLPCERAINYIKQARQRMELCSQPPKSASLTTPKTATANE